MIKVKFFSGTTVTELTRNVNKWLDIKRADKEYKFKGVKYGDVSVGANKGYYVYTTCIWYMMIKKDKPSIINKNR